MTKFKCPLGGPLGTIQIQMTNIKERKMQNNKIKFYTPQKEMRCELCFGLKRQEDGLALARHSGGFAECVGMVLIDR